MKMKRLVSTLGIAALGLGGLISVPTTRAVDWANPGTGDWAAPANWIGGAVPNNVPAFIGNGGTAVVSTTVPNCNEAAAGNAGGAGFIIVTNGGTLNVNYWMVMGRMFESSSTTPFSRFTIHNGTVNKAGDGLIVGDNYGGMASEGELIVAGTGRLNVTGGWFGIGNGNGSKGSVTFKDSAVHTGVGDFNVGDYGTATGFLTVQDNALITISGIAFIGKNNGTVGTWNQSGGTFNANSWFSIGRYAGASGQVTISGGSINQLNAGNAILVGEEGTGVLTITNIGLVTSLGYITVGPQGSANGTINLDGGTLVAKRIVGGNGVSVINLNGGTLRAGAGANPNFLSGIGTVSVSARGALIDSAGTDITIASVLSDNGGGNVTKLGAGTLTLGGANNYTGTTAVNAGGLIVTTDATGGGAFTVANSAALSVKVNAASGQLAMTSLTLASSTAATLNFDLGGFGNPGMAPLNVSGTLTLNGTITVNVSASLLQIGQVPLVQYAGSKSGTGSCVLGTLPAGVEATLVDDGLGTISLNVTSVGLPRWDGQVAGGVWDLKTTPNWIEQSTGLPTTFNDGAPVLFNDEALGTTTVNLVATVKPLSVTVTNENLPYTIVGAGKISGATSLLKQGTNTLTIATRNDYTGRTVISRGTLAVTNLANGGSASAIGASSSSPTNLVLSGGTLSYSGAPVSIDRGYTVQGAVGVIEAQSDLTLSGRMAAGMNGGVRKTGAAKLTYTGLGINELSGGGLPGFNVTLGTVVFNGSAGTQTNHIQNELWVGGGVDGNSTVILTNTTLNVDSWVAVARGNGTVGNTSSLTLYNSVLRSGAMSMGFDGGIAGNLAQQFTTLNGTSAITNNGDMNLGESAGSTSSMQLNDSSALYSGWRVMVGWHNNATGAVTLANSSKLAVNAWMSVGNEGGIGTFTMKNDSSCWVLWDMNITDVNAGDGTLLMQDNAQLTAGALFVAKGAGSTGTATIKDNVRITANNLYVANATGAIGIVNQTGGTVTTAGNEFQIGVRSAGTYNMSGGVVNSDANWTSIGRLSGSVGELNLSGGVFNHTDAGRLVQVGEEGLGTLNLSGTGILNAAGDRLQIASAAASAGYVNLNGGTLVARRIGGGAGSSTFTFNGGTLRAAPNAQADFMSGLTLASVVAGGAVIDTSTNNLAIVQDLVGDGSGGGLTKLGTGGLALMGVSTYDGLTLVSAGTLGGNGTISGPVTVSAGAGLAPGTSIGTLTINNPLTLAAGSTTTMELNKTLGTNDMVAGLGTVRFGGTLVLKNLAGKLAVGDTFTLFNTGDLTGAFTNYVSDTPGQVVTWNTEKLQLDGTVKVLTATTIPVQLTSAVSGGKLNLAWPASQIGWELQTQVNPLTVGLSTNWSAVAGSTATNQMSFPINPASGSTFFRLVFP